MTPQRRLKTASELFAGGRFAESEALCRELAAADFRPPELCGLLGELLVLANRPDEAQPWLDAALAELPESPRLLGLLALCHTRRDRLAEAAALYRRLARPALADKLERLAPDGWYRLSGTADVPWLPDTPLPLVTARINGIEGRFLVDTGVGETLVDPALARAAGIESLGEEPIHFPAGPAGSVAHAVVPELALDRLTLAGVPAQIHPTREAFASLIRVPVDGILGSGLLFHMPATLDYPARRLRLGPGEAVHDGISFYLAGDQYPLVRARVNDRLDALLFLDTGMSGAAAGFPLSIARAADLPLAVAATGEGFGVASTLAARPLLCPVIEAAGLRRHDLPGMLLGRFRLEHRFGFRIGGLLGDGFVNRSALSLDFGRMRLRLTAPGCAADRPDTRRSAAD